jgi:hypothetical protein
MKKQIWIGAGIVVVLLVAAMFFVSHQQRSLSPADHIEVNANGVEASIDYCRPSVRDRVVFGTEADGALQPYGIYWRFGANESTEITFLAPVLFAGELVEAGTYKIYAIPNKESFEIVLSTQLGTWGYSEPDYSLDLLRTKIPVTYSGETTEQHTLAFEESTEGVNLICMFELIRLEIPIGAK